MKMKRNYPLNVSARAWAPQMAPARSERPVKKDRPPQDSLKPPDNGSSRIDDLLGDFSEQTGANFG